MLLLLSVVPSALIPLALANAGGITGYSTSGCSCHGASADATTTVSFPTLPSSVAPGETITVDLQVATTSGSRTAAGLNLSVDGGTLAAGTNNRLSGGEITHSSRTALSSGSVTFSMSWTAPSAPGVYTFSAAGNAVNANSANSGDGWDTATASISVASVCTDDDGDGYETCDDGSGDDCDDTDAGISPGADEVCDGVDNDCDGATDEDPVDGTTWYPDADGDTYGDATLPMASCNVVAGYVADDNDCNDADATVYPAAPEFCDGVDDDCDGNIDEVPRDGTPWYADVDRDGQGDPNDLVDACEAPEGYVGRSTDCDDTNSTVYFGATELCDSLDNDCDGAVDDNVVYSDWYPDADIDGYGDDAMVTSDCIQPSGYISVGGDCDDTDRGRNPGATEICDDADRDEDCDSLADNDDPSVTGTGHFFADNDGDSYGAGSMYALCDQVAGYVLENTDCNDADASVNPAAAEQCDGLDNNCDGTADEGLGSAYPDADGDGYGDATADPSCTATGVDNAEDCDDGDAGINPDATETWYDDVDQDCDGRDDDQDSDGFGVDDDCDDLDDEVNPDATEVWYDDVDGDCSGGSDYDADADGHESANYGGDDCDDAAASTYPGAPDKPYDGVVTDCNAADEFDQDGDGYEYGTDCDDANSKITEGTTWYPDGDGDGHGSSDGGVVACEAPKGHVSSADDCDDADAKVWEDCDGETGDTGDTDDTGDSGETDETGETGDTSDTAGETGGGDKDTGCGCASTPTPAGWWAGIFLAVATVLRRNRR